MKSSVDEQWTDEDDADQNAVRLELARAETRWRVTIGDPWRDAERIYYVTAPDAEAARSAAIEKRSPGARWAPDADAPKMLGKIVLPGGAWTPRLRCEVVRVQP